MWVEDSKYRQPNKHGCPRSPTSVRSLCYKKLLLVVMTFTRRWSSLPKSVCFKGLNRESSNSSQRVLSISSLTRVFASWEGVLFCFSWPASFGLYLELITIQIVCGHCRTANHLQPRLNSSLIKFIIVGVVVRKWQHRAVGRREKLLLEGGQTVWNCSMPSFETDQTFQIGCCVLDSFVLQFGSGVHVVFGR